MIEAQAIRHLRSTRPFFHAIRLFAASSLTPLHTDSFRFNHIWCSTTAVPITRIYQSFCYFALLLWCALCTTRMGLKPGRYLVTDFRVIPRHVLVPSVICHSCVFFIGREPSSPSYDPGSTRRERHGRIRPIACIVEPGNLPSPACLLQTRVRLASSHRSKAQACLRLSARPTRADKTRIQQGSPRVRPQTSTQQTVQLTPLCCARNK